MAKKKWKTQDYLAVGGLVVLVMHLTSRGRQQPNGGSQTPPPPPSTGGGTTTTGASIPYYLEVFERTMDTCYWSCCHRCSNFETIFKELSDSELAQLDQAFYQKHGKTLVGQMDTYWDWGCGNSCGYDYIFSNYGRELYNKLKNLGL